VLTPGSAEPADSAGSRGVPGARLLDLVTIMDRLRVSCPWDRQQTHESLVRYLLEEAYEAVDTVAAGDYGALREEIGDVLLQVFFHARIAAERPSAEGGFTIDDVAETLAAKLIRRHPHVFGPNEFSAATASSAAEVNANWEEIKKAERAARAEAADAGRLSVLDGVAFGQPALSLAAQLQRRAERAGITVSPEAQPGAAGDASTPSTPSTPSSPSSPGELLGAELMALVARARAAGLDPELELRAAALSFAAGVREREQLLPFAGAGLTLRGSRSYPQKAFTRVPTVTCGKLMPR
jgi:XTP/dITP diphosphohydrolase